jgi:RNA polymerase sigma factor (sigma-70 family)
MTTSDTWRDRIAELLEHSKVKGIVTYDEINNLFADTTVESEEIETILGIFAAAGVPVVDSGDLPVGVFTPARKSDKPKDDEEAGAFDPVEAYMRDIERFKPLPPEEQDTFTRELAEGLETVAEAVLNTVQGRERLSEVLAAKHGTSHVVRGADAVASILASNDEMGDRTTSKFHGQSSAAREQVLSELSDLGIRISDLEDVAMSLTDSVVSVRAGIERLEDARNRLVEGHIRLVPYLARRYSNRGVEYLDLVQEGNTGLVRATKRFDPTKGQRFATYATWWIRQAMTKAINEQGRAVRIPQILLRERKRLNRAREELRQELSREPTRQELATALDVDIERVHRLIDMTKSPLRLDHPSGDSDALPLGDVIDIGSEDWTVTPLYQLLRRELHDVLSMLDPPEREVMKLRFGLDDDQPCTLAEVCKRLQMSKERVRRIEARALLKLRHPDHRDRLPNLP